MRCPDFRKYSIEAVSQGVIRGIIRGVPLYIPIRSPTPQSIGRKMSQPSGGRVSQNHNFCVLIQ